VDELQLERASAGGPMNGRLTRRLPAFFQVIRRGLTRPPARASSNLSQSAAMPVDQLAFVAFSAFNSIPRLRDDSGAQGVSAS